MVAARPDRGCRRRKVTSASASFPRVILTIVATTSATRTRQRAIPASLARLTLFAPPPFPARAAYRTSSAAVVCPRRRPITPRCPRMAKTRMTTPRGSRATAARLRLAAPAPAAVAAPSRHASVAATACALRRRMARASACTAILLVPVCPPAAPTTIAHRGTVAPAQIVAAVPHCAGHCAPT